MQNLDNNVAYEADEENDHHNVELHPGAKVGGVRVCNHKAGALPKSVVGERSFLVTSKQHSVQT